MAFLIPQSRVVEITNSRYHRLHENGIINTDHCKCIKTGEKDFGENRNWYPIITFTGVDKIWVFSTEEAMEAGYRRIKQQLTNL